MKLKRRVLALVAALMLTRAAGASGPFCVDTELVTALVDEQGGELIANGACERVFPVSDSLFAAGSRGDYRLYDATGAALGEARFSMACAMGQTLIFLRDGLYGAMDLQGRVQIEPGWTRLTSNGLGGFLALAGDPLDDQPDEIYRVDADGSATPTGSHTLGGLSAVSDGRMPFMDSAGRWGYVDAEGAESLPAAWRYAGPFLNGLAVVARESGKGLIDVDGRAVLEPVYARLERGEALIVGQTAEGALEAYAPDGRTPRFTLEGAGLRFALVGGGVAVTDAEGARLYDAGGKLVCSASPSAAFAEGPGDRYIVSDGTWGEACQWLIDAEGRAVSERYQRLLPLTAGRCAFITMSGVEYYSNELDAAQTSWDYDSVRYGLLDADGRELLPAEYLEIRGLAEDRLLLVGAGEVCLADADGAVLRRWTATP